MKAKQAAGDPAAIATAELLFDTALLTSGFTIEQPAEFAAKIFSLMDKAVVGAGGAAPPPAAPPPAAPPPEKSEAIEPEIV